MSVIRNESIEKVETLKLQNIRQSNFHIFFSEIKLSAVTINVKYNEIFTYDDFFF